MRFEVLGPLRAFDGNVELDLGEPQQRKVLALLLAAPDGVLSTGRLIDEMWPGEAPASARHLVHVYVARLRAVLRASDDDEPVIRSPGGYRLHLADSQVDAAELETAVKEARALGDSNPEAAVRRLHGALENWRGRPFDDLADASPLLQAEADRLEELRLAALEDLADAEVRLGRHLELVDRLGPLIAEHPYRERLWQLRMIALYRCGRQAEALSAYHDLREILAEELGIEPGTDVVELERRILLQDPGLLWEPPPPPSNLPGLVSSFIGRHWELEEIGKLLDRSRLVTLTGPGGIGKTRLAIETAAAALPRFPEGVWWVDLGQVQEHELVPAALADVLGVQLQSGGRLEDPIIAALARRSTLLVLDNCEHLSSAVAPLAREILRGARRVQVLATSRSPLRAPGEVVWTVPPMGIPVAMTGERALIEGSDAVRLFVARGRAADSDIVFDDADLDAVADICRRLDGLPLAIEMAAARLRVLSPGQISEALTDRFALLAASGGESRHETLEAAFDWSFELLDPGQRRVFERLSVFEDAFDLEAADAVGEPRNSTILEAVTALVDASMLETAHRPARTTRYRLLETMREYGRHRLHLGSEEHDTLAAHAAYYLGLVERASHALDSSDFATWAERLRAVYPDLRRALGWSMEHDSRERVLSLARALFHLWWRTGDAQEAGHWGDRMLDGADTQPGSLRAGGHLLLSFSANMRGDRQVAMVHAESAVELYRASGDRVGLATALFGRANVALLTGDPERAAAVAQEMLAVSEETGSRWSRAGALAILGFVLWAGGSLDDARRRSEEAASIYRELDDLPGQVVMCPVGEIAIAQGDLGAADSLARRAVAASVGTAWEGAALVMLAEVLVAQGDDDTEPVARLGMTKALDTGLELWFRRALLVFARARAGTGDAPLAAVLLGASRRDAFDTEIDPETVAFIEERCRSDLGDHQFERAERRGHDLSHEQLLDLVSRPDPSKPGIPVAGRTRSE